MSTIPIAPGARRARAFSVLAAVALLLTTVLGYSSHGVSAASKQSPNLYRAVLSYKAVQDNYYLPDSKLYRPFYPMSGGNPYSYVWPFSQAYAMTNDVAGLPRVGRTYSDDVQARIAGLAPYYSSNGRAPNDAIQPNFPSPPGYDSYVNPPYGNSGDKFYDDNDWIGLDFVQTYYMTGDTAALDKAKEIFALQIAGWDTHTDHPCPGGVFWTQASWSQDRNTVSNAPAAELGFHLYTITKDQQYFDWAKKMYDWVNTCMRAPNGLYFDHISLSGDVEKTLWSYNQGTMIGANVLLYRITGQRQYLRQAEQIAEAAMEYYGTAGRLWRQDPIFNTIFFRNLLQLEAVNHDTKYRQMMQSYADEVWKIRDPETGLFVWEPYKPLDLNQQAAMVQIYALLAWDPRDYQKIT